MPKHFGYGRSMKDGPGIAEIAALMGDPARANILSELANGRALTATELSFVAGVSPQTTSEHLTKLAQGKLLSVEKQGRHRYFRLAGPEVNHALEALMVVAEKGPRRYRRPGPTENLVRYARTCYDHLAGTLGVQLTDALVARGDLSVGEEAFSLTPDGEARLGDLGIVAADVRKRRRAFARRCLDWSERRPHLAGALGAALTDRLFDLNWIERVPDSRAVTVTAAGRRGLKKTLGVEIAARP